MRTVAPALDRIEDWEADVLEAIQTSSTILESSPRVTDTVKCHYNALRRALKCVDRISCRLSEASQTVREKIVSATYREEVTLLPPEVLGIIFEFTVQGADDSHHSTANAAISLSHVCQSWRYLALDTPRLWTKVNLLGGVGKVRAFLQRSKGVPIDISLVSNDYAARADTREELTEILKAVLAHGHRWRALTWLADTTYENYDLVTNYFARVKTPSLEEITCGLMEDIVLRHIPCLRRLHITCGGLAKPIDCQSELLSRLTSFSCHINPVQINFLAFMPRLITLHIGYADFFGSWSDRLELTELRLLRKLTLDGFDEHDIDSLFTNVAMPQLASLTLILKEQVDFRHIRLQRSYFLPLESLYVSTRGSFDQSESEDLWTVMAGLRVFGFDALLDHMPTLHSLTLSHMGYQSSDYVIASLQNRVLALQKLEIQECYIRPSDLISLFRFRGVENVSPIEHFAIRRCPTIPLELQPRLERLCRSLDWESFWDTDEKWNNSIAYVRHIFLNAIHSKNGPATDRLGNGPSVPVGRLAPVRPSDSNGFWPTRW